jgi:hypothetical protein
MDFIKGKKTYLVAALLVLVGLVNALSGEIGAWQGVMDNALILLNGLGLGFLRAGIASGPSE